MCPELDELNSSSAGTGLKTPGQPCPPDEGIWEERRTTANGFLTAAVDSSQGGRIPSTTGCVDTRADKSTIITADTTFLQQGLRPRSEENKQFDPGGKGEKAPPWKVAVTLPSFSGESWKAPCLLSVCASCSVLCVCLFPKLLFSSQVMTSQKRREGRRGQVANRRASVFSPTTLLKMARTSHTRFGRSANALR